MNSEGYSLVFYFFHFVISTASSLWKKIVKPRFLKLRDNLGTTDDIARRCYMTSLITDEEFDYLKNQRTKSKHNEYLLDALCNNSSDESFCNFVKVLEDVLTGERYRSVVDDLKKAYLKERETSV